MPSARSLPSRKPHGARASSSKTALHAIRSSRGTNGPHLHRLVGRKAGSAAGFDYSDAFQKLNDDGITWTEANLRAFLRSPQRFVPGAQMWQVILDEEIITVDRVFQKYPYSRRIALETR